MKRIATTLLVAGLFASPMLALPLPAAAGISIGISVGIPPPVLPVYAQPIIPGPGYIWTPGYWAWDPGYDGYYWVAGTWVLPPQVGLLWTPGWWGWSEGFYRWHGGYWGMHVGFYGGVNYGFGYFGTGYVGGYWRGGNFFYNRAVNNINITNIHNVYVNRTVVNNINGNRASYNGGRGGVTAQPTAAQRAVANQHRFAATSMQKRQREAAMHDPDQRFTVNQGRPSVVATRHPGKFNAPHAARASFAASGRASAKPEDVRRMVEAPHDRVPPPEHPMQTATARERDRMERMSVRQRAEFPGNAPRNEMPARSEPTLVHAARHGDAQHGKTRDDYRGHDKHQR